MVKDSLVVLENAVVNVTCLSQSGELYTGEQVIALLAKAQKPKLGTSKGDKEGWIEHN